MAHYEEFEDLPIWQKSRELAVAIYACSDSGKFAADTGLKNQIRRAAVSVMSNIAEGFERKSNRDFVKFLSIAKASLAEVRSQLYLALDLSYLETTMHIQLKCAWTKSRLRNRWLHAIPIYQ